MLREVSCNGIMLRNRMAMVGEMYGLAAQRDTEARLSDDFRTSVRYQTILARNWYPIAWLRELHQAAREATGAGVELSRQLGKIGAKRNFKGVHRAFFSVLSVKFVVGRAPRIHRTYFDGGKLDVVELDVNRSVIRWQGCLGFDRDVWESMLGGIEAVLELCGCHDVRLRFIHGGQDGDSEAEAQAFWVS